MPRRALTSDPRGADTAVVASRHKVRRTVLSRYRRFRLNHPMLALTEDVASVVALVVISSLDGRSLRDHRRFADGDRHSVR
jgi:hypothetical protein